MAAMSKIAPAGLVETFRLPAVIGHELARTLSERIIFLDLQPGARLAEDEICTEYQVSRSPVREAFRALEADGLVVRSVRRGVRVAPMGRRDLREVYACRVVLEGLAAREAAQNATPDHLARMQTLLDSMGTALRRRQTRPFFDSNVAFTNAIHEASTNATLLRIAAGIEKQALRYRYLAHDHTAEMRETAFEGHSRVFRAIVQGDAALAEKEGQASIRRAHAVIQRVVEARWPADADPAEDSARWNTPI
jgi:GntR family transcriptional regulator, rspAB operon transcriptional repressor